MGPTYLPSVVHRMCSQDMAKKRGMHYLVLSEASKFASSASAFILHLHSSCVDRAASEHVDTTASTPSFMQTRCAPASPTISHSLSCNGHPRLGCRGCTQPLPSRGGGREPTLHVARPLLAAS